MKEIVSIITLYERHPGTDLFLKEMGVWGVGKTKEKTRGAGFRKR
jgi:hypothetical protein